MKSQTNQYCQLINKNIAISISFITALFILMFSFNTAKASTATSNARDCDNNAVMKCGALTTKELQLKYMNPDDPSARYIFNSFGISNLDIQNLESTAVLGQVTKSGDVLVEGNVVATNAVTAGRLNMPGSTKVDYQGVTYYKRLPKVSFNSQSLQALVVIENNIFKYAILTSCGNPVIATPVTPQVVEKIVIRQTETPPIVVQTKAVQVKNELPKTGNSDVIKSAIIIAVIASLLHYVFKNRRQIKLAYDNFVLSKLYR